MKTKQQKQKEGIDRATLALYKYEKELEKERSKDGISFLRHKIFKTKKTIENTNKSLNKRIDLDRILEEPMIFPL